MKKTIAIILLLVFYSSFGTLQAQNLNDFTRLEAKGAIPKDFLIRSSEKIKTDQDANEDEDLDKKFFESTRYAIDELLLSGQILFNEELSIYLNKVANYTLSGEKELLSQLRFYVLKSTEVNAYSTDQGIIFFTTGLLAQLENEAQLAYIIAHEASHFILKHVREGYVEDKEIRSGTGKYERTNNKSVISQLTTYQKENELAADRKGIEIYLKTEYGIDEIFTSFEMLLYSYLPFNELKFDTNFFNTEFFKIPSIYFPDTSNTISLDEDYDDSDHSHPNIQTRIDKAFEVLGENESQGNLKYKISETDFIRIRHLARFEGLNLLLSQREYVKTLYTVFLLKKEFPNNRFIDLCTVKALYGLAKYKNANRYNEVTEKPKNIEGESFILHFFFNKIKQEALNVLAYRVAYDMSFKYRADKTFALYEKEMKKELAINSDIKLSELKDVSFNAYSSEIKDSVLIFDIDDSIAKIEISTLSKYEKIRLKKKLQELKENKDNPISTADDYYLYGLSDLVSNGKFIDELKALDKAEEERIAEEEGMDENGNERKKTKDNSGFDKIVLVDPYFVYYSNNKSENYEKAEQEKVEVSNLLYKDYPKLELDKTLIDSKQLNEESVSQYNEIGLIFQWMQEVVEHDELGMISSSNDLMENLEKKYGTEHFVFTGFFGYKARKEARPIHLIGLMFLPSIPFVIGDLLIVRNNMQIVAISINSSTDQIEFSSSEEVAISGSSKVIEVYIYDLLYRLKNNQ
jgi:hypothetical protein